MLKTITLLLLSLTTITYSLAQRAKQGSYTVTAANTQLNAYTAVTANAAAGATSVTVAANALTNSFFTTSLAAGDLVMIIQMQGATMDVDVTATASWGGHYTTPNGHLLDWGSYQDLWGNVTAYNNAGKYELREVRSISGSTVINFTCGLQNSYTSTGHVQVVRVPRLQNLTLNASTSIVPALWDGTVGGVVALEVLGTLTFNTGSKIMATGYGFRGGACDLLTAGSPPGSAANVGYCASDAATEGAEKGEGIGGFYTEYDALYSRYCKSAPANGGGGGGNHNAGGGGGSNIGTGAYTGKGNPQGYAAIWNIELAGFATSTSSGGGRGGYSYATSNQNEASVGPNNTAWSGDYRRAEGGLGGHPLTYDATRVFMGGGGGAGDANSSPTQGGAGGRGGGIVYLTVYGTVTGTGTMESNGAVGQNANPAGQTATSASSTKYGNDGAGGAGGGGAIVIANGTALPNTLTLAANGGTGGNQVISFGSFSTPAMESDGPGGGGAGGMIALTSGSPVQTVTGGMNGTTNSTYVNTFPPNGATAGAAGTSGLTQSHFNLTSNGVTICPNTSTTLTATVTGTLPGGASINWYATQFGTTILGTGTTYNTPVLSSTTTYYVGTCPGTFRIPVTVTVSAGPTISGVLTVPVGGTTTLTGSGTPNATTPWTSGNNAIGTVTSAGVVTGVSVGTVTITYMNSSGCTVSAIVNVTAPLPVELMYFDAQLNTDKTVDLIWATETEINNDYFVVERSPDLKNWYSIANTDGAGTSDWLIHYREQDGSPQAGENYYRLKQIDFDGMIRLSDIKTVYLSDDRKLLYYPNPANDQLHITGDDLDNMQISIVSNCGQLVSCEQSLAEDGHWIINTSQLASGIYAVKLTDESHQEVFRITVVHF